MLELRDTAAGPAGMTRSWHALAILVTTVLMVAPVANAQADKPAVSALNGKISGEGGVTGFDGHSSGIGLAKGSITAPLGHSFGVQLDGLAGTAFNSAFGGGTAHLFWRDPSIGLVGPVVSMAAGGGERLGWYGAEAELYAGLFTFGAWGGYHDVVNNRFGTNANSGFYGGSLTVYPLPDLALSVGATSEFSRVTGVGTVEFQPDLFGRHNVSFYVNGDLADRSTFGVTAGIRIYFGADKALIRRHREDDPMTMWESAYAGMTTVNGQSFIYGYPYQPIGDAFQNLDFSSAASGIAKNIKVGPYYP